MSTIAVLITALALAMDAMSLSIYQGIASTENQRKQNFIKIILTFGIFQFAMALVGSLSGSLFVHYISLYSKYISFAIFLFLGLMMLKEALKKEKENMTDSEKFIYEYKNEWNNETKKKRFNEVDKFEIEEQKEISKLFLEDFENEEKPSKKTIEKIKKAKGILNS